jgi:hypothetical protein
MNNTKNNVSYDANIECYEDSGFELTPFRSFLIILSFTTFSIISVCFL